MKQYFIQIDSFNARLNPPQIFWCRGILPYRGLGCRWRRLTFHQILSLLVTKWMEHIPFGSRQSNATITQPSQGDSNEDTLTSVQPEDVLQDELQDIEDRFLSTPTTSTTTNKPSQCDGKDVAPTFVQHEYILLLVEEPLVTDPLPLLPTPTDGTTLSLSLSTFFG